MIRRSVVAFAVVAWVVQACGGVIVGDVDADIDSGGALEDSGEPPDASGDAEGDDAEMDAFVCPDYLTTGPCEGGTACGDGAACILFFASKGSLGISQGCYPTSQCENATDLCGCVGSCVCEAGTQCIESNDGYYVSCGPE